MGRVIGFVSVKGGVGKTTLVGSLGSVLANDFKKNVLIVDANFSGANLALQFGIVDFDFGIQDVLNGAIGFSKAVQNIAPRLDILPAELVHKSCDCSKLRGFVEDVRKKYDFVLLDGAASSGSESRALVDSVDELFVVTSPDYVTLSCTLQALKMAKENCTYVSGLVLNKVTGVDYELSFSDVESHTRAPVVSVFRDDIDILKALSNHKTVDRFRPKSDNSVELKKLAGALAGVNYKDRRFSFSRIFGRGSRELSKDEVNRMILMHSHY